MTNFPTWIAVVALALFDDEGRLLLQQRGVGKHHGGAWEFPGGKVEASEKPREALVREIEEELGLQIAPADLHAACFAEEGEGPAIVLFLYTAQKWLGEPRGRDGQEWGWFTAQEASALPLAPMDRDLFGRLSR